MKTVCVFATGGSISSLPLLPATTTGGLLLFLLLLFSSSLVSVAHGKVFNVLDYGAVENDDSLATAKENGEVFYTVVTTLANTPPNTRDLNDADGYNTVIYPKSSSASSSSSSSLYYVPFKPFVNLYKIHFVIGGTIVLPNSNESRSTWPSNDLPHPTLRRGEGEGEGGDSVAHRKLPHAGDERTALAYAASSVLSAVSHLRGRRMGRNDDDRTHSRTKQSAALDAFYILNSTGIRFDGGGAIHGQGYPWWWDTILTGVDRRPYLFMIKGTSDIYLGHLELRDSPMYHVFLQDVRTVLVEFLNIYVDIWGQLEIQNKGRALTQKMMMGERVTEEEKLTSDGGTIGHYENQLLFAGPKRMPLIGTEIPTFPLNTDGIDIAGVDVVVRHCTVENFDDALCPKPLNKLSVHGPCSRNQHWYNHTITYGVGASIGSVPPNPAVNCISDIVIEDVHFTNALKTLYIKPNPCPNPSTDGTGIINNITYRNIVSVNPVTWPLWFSTQQQKQPGSGTNTGCSFLFPLPGEECPVFPCVPITNVHLKNVTATGGLLSPGVMRCDPSNPCVNYTFEDVNIRGDGFPWGKDAYLCEGLDNVQFVGDSYPSKCIYNYTA